MKKRKIYSIIIFIIIVMTLLFVSCSPIREFRNWPTYLGANDFEYKQPSFDSLKKTVIIIADNDGTEIFDLMAPYYLFNATGKANVYIVSEKKYPIIIRKGFFILPQFTFNEFDLSNIKPDAIIVPNLSAMGSKDQNLNIIRWIKKKYEPSTQILSVCSGASTVAATGIYDGKPLATHASDYAFIKEEYNNPEWVKNISVTESNNLYSTAGVSNAVEGSLTLINKMFGEKIMKRVMENVNYPHRDIKIKHHSTKITFGHKLTILNKVTFKKNKSVGVLLFNDINEFELAAIMDTYNRSFPKSIESFVINGNKITSKYGLTIIPSGNINNVSLDELHIIDPSKVSSRNTQLLGVTNLIKYENLQKNYIFDQCLDRIDVLYGKKYKDVVKVLLDYN